MKETSTLSIIKRTILIAVVAVISILLCFTYLFRQSAIKGQEEKLIINKFGKQRMYTQMISKDAGQIYALMQSSETDQFYATEYGVTERISKARKSLSQARENFSETLDAMHSGELKVGDTIIPISSSIMNSEYLEELDEQWAEFDKNIEILISAEDSDRKMSMAAIYIDDNNMELLTLCDDLMEEILRKSVQQGRVFTYIMYSLIGLLVLIIFASVTQLQKHIVQPFSQLYKGITDIGLANYPNELKFPTENRVAPIVTEISDVFKKINYLISLIENINNNDSFMDTLKFINNTFSSFIPYNYIGIGLIDDNKEMLIASYGVADETIIGMPEQMVGASWPISTTSMGALLKSGEGRIINDLEAYCEGKPLKAYNKIILQAGIKASITLPLKVSGQPVGLIFFSSSQKNVYNPEHLKLLKTLANSIAISLEQNIFIRDILYSSILALAKLAETRDEDTGEHLERMAIYTRAIAELLFENNIYTEEISLEYIDQLERFSPLHDIGKVGIVDGILLKPGKLTPEEFEEMKKHAVFGAQVLRSSEENMQKKGKSLFGMGIDIAEGHHEKWDGTGYPYGKKGEEIPLSARIVALADVFDALTSKRPYKKAFSLEISMDIITEGRGKHFDPKIVDIFMANRKRIEKIYEATSLLKKV